MLSEVSMTKYKLMQQSFILSLHTPGGSGGKVGHVVGPGVGLGVGPGLSPRPGIGRGPRGVA